MIVPDFRTDFRGGVNTAYSDELVQPNELRVATNFRLNTYGALVKRNATKRFHSAAIASAADVLGVFQWDAPAVTGQVVAVAGGNFYHKTIAATAYTEVSGSLSTTILPWFVVHIQGGTRKLYIADGGLLNSWDGTTLTQNIAGSPSARSLGIYGRRLFVTDNTKTLRWSAVDDPEDFTSASGGGSSPVETFDDEPLVGLAHVGSSLLLFKQDSIARFTGVASTDIRIDLDTEGVSADIGCIAPKTIVRFEQFVFFLSDLGPYAATEAGVIAIGEKIENKFDARDWSDAVAAHHKGAREVWLYSQGLGEGWIYNYRLGSWTGPHDFSSTFEAYSMAAFEDASGFKFIQCGGGDGFIRHGDSTANSDSTDDYTSSDTGGTAITAQADLPDLLFADPTAVKIAQMTQWVHADLKSTSGSLQFITNSELMAAALTVTIPGTASGVLPYKAKPGWRGRRLSLTLKEATAETIQINAIELMAKLGRRAA